MLSIVLSYMYNQSWRTGTFSQEKQKKG